jgi:hypothetical protein
LEDVALKVRLYLLQSDIVYIEGDEYIFGGNIFLVFLYEGDTSTSYI